MTLANLTLRFSYLTRVLLRENCSLHLTSNKSAALAESLFSSTGFPFLHHIKQKFLAIPIKVLFISHLHVPHHLLLHLRRVILISACPVVPTPSTAHKLTSGRISSTIFKHQPLSAFLLRLPYALIFSFETLQQLASASRCTYHVDQYCLAVSLLLIYLQPSALPCLMCPSCCSMFVQSLREARILRRDDIFF